jgi:hypothetical protein
MIHSAVKLVMQLREYCGIRVLSRYAEGQVRVETRGKNCVAER